MSIAKVAVLFLVFGFIGDAANAGSIRCGTHLIQDDQIEPVSRGFVLEKCGPPHDQYGEVLIYKRGNSRIALRFNANGQLQEIEEEK
jgi:hypothetical protein